MHLVRTARTLHLLMLLQFLQTGQTVGAKAAGHHLRTAVLLLAERTLGERGRRDVAIAGGQTGADHHRMAVGGR